ncbi:MAG TPA: hypothetical protein VGR03_15555 [Candidatus Acidoferrum sp.]|nr:hypothetical protein [Candidatus Acidoferrum sp.]
MADELNNQAVDPGTGAEPVPAPGAPAAGADPGGGAGAGTGTPAAGTPAPVETANTRQFREAFEALKAKYEPWEKLNAKPEEVATGHSAYQKISTEAHELGATLGFTLEQIDQALKDDLVGTLAWLRSEALRKEKEAGGPDVRQLVKREMEEWTKPLNEHMRKQREAEATRKADEGNFTFNQEFKKQIEAKYPDEATRPGDKGGEWVYQRTCELIAKDQQALDGLNRGKVSSVAKYFEQANADYLALVGEHGTRETARVQHKPGEKKPPANGNKRPSLQELIEDPGLIHKKYA